MKWEVLFPIIVFGVYILSHVIKAGEDAKKPTRPPFDPDRDKEPRPVRRVRESDDQVDRFLEEVNRRRRQIMEGRKAQAAAEAPAPAPPPLRAPLSAPKRPARTQTPGRRSPAAEILPRKRESKPRVEIEIPLALSVPDAIPAASQPAEGKPQAPGIEQAFGNAAALGKVATIQAKSRYPEAEELTRLIASPQSLRSLMLLHFALEAPLCRRSPLFTSLAHTPLSPRPPQ